MTKRRCRNIVRKSVLMKIGICDDVLEVREMIAGLVRRKYPAEEICLYGAGKDLLTEEKLPDILFMDIQMPGINGMETAGMLRERKRQICIIFVTVMPDMVFEAFDVGAFHYLVKPFTQEKFYEVLNKAVDWSTEQNYFMENYYSRRKEGKSKEENRGRKACIVIKQGGVSTRVCLRDIIYAEVFNRKVLLHTITDDIEYYGRLSDLEKQAGEDFFRVHRAYLVNMAYVVRYNAHAVILEKGQAMIAKQKYGEFVKAYLTFCKQEQRKKEKLEGRPDR